MFDLKECESLLSLNPQSIPTQTNQHQQNKYVKEHGCIFEKIRKYKDTDTCSMYQSMF